MRRINGWYILVLMAAIVLILVTIFTTMIVTAGEKVNPYEEPVEFEATAYCETGNPTKSGVYPLEGRTIAVDPRVIPLGSTVIVYDENMDMLGIYQAEDTGGKIKGKIIDIYMENEDDCWEWGRQKVFVQVVQAEG